MAQPNRSRLETEARFLATWGYLLRARVAEDEILAHLSEEAGAPDLRQLARELNKAHKTGTPLPPVVDREGRGLSFWVQVLLQGEGLQAEVLLAAADLLGRETHGAWNASWLWSKLRLLHRASAPNGEGLGALAREARDHGRTKLAEAFYAAARNARQGAELAEALRETEWFPRGERLVLKNASDETLDDVLAALEGLAAFAPAEAPAETAASAPPESTFETIAQAASEKAAPIKRGLDRVLSGIEDLIGIGPPPSRSDLARETVQARAAARTEPESPPAKPSQPEPAPEKKASKKSSKTMGGDSGMVRIRGSEIDSQASPLDRWVYTLDEARAKVTMLQVQPAETGIAREATAELRTLRAELGDAQTSGQREQLEALEARFKAWNEEHAE